MRWLFFAATVIIALWSLWLLLLAYRVVGKRAGEDPKYDAWIADWTGAFKVMGVLGLLTLIFEVVELVFELF